MPSTDTKSYTPGAERAAREVMLQHWKSGGYGATVTDKECAEIISRETHDAEMLEALKLALETGFEYHNRPEYMAEDNDCPICLAYIKIEALIAKVEGR